MKAIRIHTPGGLDVLRYEDAPLPEPGPGEARIKVEVAGLNFIDIYQRTGAYKLALPFTPGLEAGGVVDAVGPGVAGGRRRRPGRLRHDQRRLCRVCRGACSETRAGARARSRCRSQWRSWCRA